MIGAEPQPPKPPLGVSQYQTVVFSCGGESAVVLPGDWGFNDGQAVLLIRVGEAIYLLPSDASEDEQQRVLALAEAHPS